MNRRTAFDRAAEMIDEAHPRFADAVQRVMDQRPGVPGAQDYSGTGGGGGGLGSPVERTLIGQHGLVPSPVAAELKELDRRLARLDADARWLADFTRRHSPQAPTEKQKAVVAEANTAADPVCEHCTAWRKPGTIERVHRTGDVAGNLQTSKALCRWCYDYVRRTAALPSKREVERNDEGLRVMVRA